MPNVVFVMDWSNISRGQRDFIYEVGQYNKEAGLQRIKDWLSSIGTLVWASVYTPMHDLYGHFELLRDHDFTVALCPVESTTGKDTTDQKIIEDLGRLIDNFKLDYLCLGSGDGGFRDILERAKEKGIKIALIYGSENSLSNELIPVVDEYPQGHPLAGERMLHLFSPTNY
jgi:uncharacterized LabA/DUF88 family protein